MALYKPVYYYCYVRAAVMSIQLFDTETVSIQLTANHSHLHHHQQQQRRYSLVVNRLRVTSQRPLDVTCHVATPRGDVTTPGGDVTAPSDVICEMVVARSDAGRSPICALNFPLPVRRHSPPPPPPGNLGF